MTDRFALAPAALLAPTAAPASHPIEQRLEQALVAMAVLVSRYARTETVEIGLGAEPADALRIALGGDPSADAVMQSLADPLAGIDVPIELPLLAWRETQGQAQGNALVLALHYAAGRWQVDPTLSQVQGLLVGDDPIAHIARHFDTVVAALIADPDAPISHLLLVDATERAHLLQRLDHSEYLPALAAPTLLHRIFADSAAAHPQQVAVEHGGVRLTYEELDRRAGRLAAGLIARGIGPGAAVAMKMRRSPAAYVALLGILKSGAAYVPLDPEWPSDRIAYIVENAQAQALLTEGAWALEHAALACPVIALDADWDAVLPKSAQAVAPRAPTCDDTCYIIYTSGSTGKPKGVAISHHSATHLVRAEQRLFAMRQSDRVFQGFSLAFDAAVEEVWLAFAAGATLVAGDKDVMLGDLGAYLTDTRVTIFSTVPTLLATLQGALPTVRVLIVGGEACPAPLVDRWAAAPRQMFNTYGPTEATVIATATLLQPHAPVTIGRPIANYNTYILDAAGQLAPVGVAGELCIGGVGLAQHYVQNPNLTQARFVHTPVVRSDGKPERIYKTGDLARYNAHGDIEFLGRIDEQVKLRGFRIELGEIEVELLQHEAVVQAHVMVREDVPGARELVAYVVPRADVYVEADALKQMLRAKLPPYMVPAQVEMLTALPTLSSGKVNRRALPPPRPKEGRTVEADERPIGTIETKLAAAWCKLLGLPGIGRNDHFFTDLDGHSMLAAQVASKLRQDPDCATLSVLDIYEAPTIAALAKRLLRDAAIAEKEPAAADTYGALRADSDADSRIRHWRYYACGAAQILGLYAIFGIFSAQWLGPYLMYVTLRALEMPALGALLVAACVLVATYPVLLVTALITKWTVIGRFKPGVYPLWGLYYFRFWLVERVAALAPTWLLVGTPLLNTYYRLMGTRIGKNVHLASDSIQCFDLVTLQDDAVVGVDASMRGHAIERGKLLLGTVHIGPGAVVGPRSVVDPNTCMQADAELGELSRLRRGDTISAGMLWVGSPARPMGRADVSQRVVRPKPWHRRGMAAAYTLLVCVLPAFIVAAMLPGLLLLNYFEGHLGHWYLVGSPLVSLFFVVAFCLEIAAAKWLFLGKMQPGRFDLFSGVVLRKWIFDRMMDMSIDMLGGLYATLFLNPWLRMLGVRIGKNAEISTASSINPDLLSIDDEAFLADCVSVGTPRIARGTMTLLHTHVGKRTFVGNSAIVPSGVSLGDDCLIGCLSACPTDPTISRQHNAAWFGSPPMPLPQRQVSAAFSIETTYRPTRKLMAARVAIESLRVTLPTTCTVALTCILMSASIELHQDLSDAAFIAVFPLMFASIGLLASVFVIGFKWALMGRYEPGERPLWSTFIWRNELVTAMHENLADPMCNMLLEGTPFAAWFFRGLGAKIGRRVYMGTTQFTEYDLVTIGDDVTLDNDCTLQTHLFEDRVMKMSTIHIHHDCSLGADSVVLYDTQMQPGAEVEPLSLLMKGEVLPQGSRWQGVPARSVRGH